MISRNDGSKSVRPTGNGLKHGSHSSGYGSKINVNQLQIGRIPTDKWSLKWSFCGFHGFHIHGFASHHFDPYPVERNPWNRREDTRDQLLQWTSSRGLSSWWSSGYQWCFQLVAVESLVDQWDDHRSWSITNPDWPSWLMIKHDQWLPWHYQ